MDILEEIIAHKRVEIDQRKQYVSPQRLYGLVEALIMNEQQAPASMRQALLDSPTGIIAEFKRRSPSKGWIRREGKADIIPFSYQQNGASALSILTDTDYFGGYDEFVQQARLSGVTIPILYKNFVIDEYQLFQARFCGATAVLLIAADLTYEACGTLMHTAHQLGLEVLLEMHGERDFEYAQLEPDMCGINNRNLGTFVTDVDNSFCMAELLPKGVCAVSESGLGQPETVIQLMQAGFRGFLMGEHFMKAEDPGQELSKFIAAL
jgi:indole-3-glycerol phosphate synthase